MKEKNLTLSILALVFLVLPTSLKAQDVYSFTPVLDGRYYAIEHNTTHKRGIVNRDIDLNPIADGYSFEGYDDLVPEYIIVPVDYDDISVVVAINQNGQKASDVAFCGVSGNKYIAYTNEGIRLTDAINQKALFLARVLGANLQMLGLNRSDNQGYDLRIIYDQPNSEVFTTLTGPFDISFYESVSVDGNFYFYIKAKLFGKEEYVKYDVLGNRLSENDFSNIASYYNSLGNSKWSKFAQLPQADKLKSSGQKLLYEAASVGNKTAINEVARELHKKGESRYLTSWAYGTGVLAKCGEALYHAGNCFYEGLNIPLNIASARYCFKKAKEFGYNLASGGLEKIDNIEKPIVLKGGPQPVIDEFIDEAKLEKLAKEGYLEAIERYCHRATFFVFGDSEQYIPDQLKYVINDKNVIDVIPLLLAAAPKDANCQLMLACVYAGVEALGGSFDYKYSFRDPTKAKYWIEKFCANPKKNEAYAWGYKKEKVESIIKNIRNLPE